jgi:hypothetical protein
VLCFTPIAESRFTLPLVRRSDSIFIFSYIGTPIGIESGNYNDKKPSLRDVARFKIDRPVACPRAESNKAGREGDGRAFTGGHNAWTNSPPLGTWEYVSCLDNLIGMVVRNEYDVEPDGPARLVAHVFDK